MKKNNKGFSLVELIVVVLIMGILAVALTPQVMKWVDKSRIAADKDTLQAVKSAAALAFTSKDVYDKSDISITISSSSTDATGSNKDNFKKVFKDYAGGDLTTFKFKKNSYNVTLAYTKQGILTQTFGGSDSDLLASEITE